MKNQRGIATELIVYAVVGLFIFGAGVTGVIAYNSAIARAESAESNLKQETEGRLIAEAEFQRLTEEGNKLNEQIAAREKDKRALEISNRKLNEKLAAALKDPKVRDWYDTPVPAAITASVRDDAEGKGAGSAKGSADLARDRPSSAFSLGNDKRAAP